MTDDGCHALRQAVGGGEVTGEFVVTPRPEDELDLVVRLEIVEVVGVEGVGLAGVGAFDVDDLGDRRRHSVARPLAAGLE